MTSINVKIRLSYCLTLTSDQLALALGCAGHDPTLQRWPSSFCASRPGACTLDASGAEYLVQTFERLVRRYRATCDSEYGPAILASLDTLFWTAFDPIERCFDLAEKDCLCSLERRIDRAERLVPHLIAIARVHWSTGAESEWVAGELEDLACRANGVCERLAMQDGHAGRFAEEDPCAAARADRLSTTLFEAAEDLRCGNWGKEGWL